VFQNLKAKYLVRYSGDFMSDFWVLPEDKFPSPVTVPFPECRLLPAAFSHTTYNLIFLTFDRETEDFAYKILT
jgi:hypothetical protein